MKLFWLIIFTIFNIPNQNIIITENTQAKSIINNEKEYPTVYFNNEFIFRQEKLEMNKDLELGYSSQFEFKIKEFEKYKNSYFFHQFEFTFEESVTFNNNEKKSFLDIIKTEWTDKLSSHFSLKQREYLDVNLKSLEITPEIFLTIENETKVSIRLIHKDFLKIWTRNKNVFKQRIVKIRDIKVSFKPKEELLFLEKQKVEISYNPKTILNNLEEINNQINSKIEVILKDAKIDPIIFNYFYKINYFPIEELNVLNQINTSFRHILEKEIDFSENIKKDTFFKKLSPPKINIFFNQEIDIHQIGINSQLITNTPKNILNEEKVFEELFNQEIWFKEHLKIRKIHTEYYEIYSNYKNIKGVFTIKVIFNKKTHVDEEILIPSEDLKESDKKPGKENVGYETIKEKIIKNNLKSFVFFAISIFSVLIICLGFLFKKFYVKFIKK